MARARGWLVVATIILSAAVYLLGNGRVALWDRDEPRFAQTSRQMLQSGDWVVPHYLDLVRTAKPAFIYWCQAGAMKLFGDNAFGARFPSAVAVVVLLIVLAAVLWKPLGSRHAAWTIFIFATSGLTIAAAKMCITDAVLLLWVTIAQLCLYEMWRGSRSWAVVLFFSIAVGLAGLTKGPVILGFEAVTLLALLVLRWIDRGWPPTVLTTSAEPPAPIRQDGMLVKAAVGLAVAAGIVLPWVLMVNHRASQFLGNAVTHEVWDRMMTPLEQHKGPPGYYFLTLWATYFPWSLLLPLTAGLAWRHRAEQRVRFCMAAVVGPWLMLECVRTKLPHYFLPAFPPLAYLTADALIRCLDGQFTDLRSRGFRIGLVIWAVITGLVALSPWLALLAYPRGLPMTAMTLVSVGGLVMAAVVVAMFVYDRPATAAIVMGLGTLGMVALMYGLYLPNAAFLRLSPRVADVLIKNGVTQPHQVMMMDYAEPSLAFYQGGTIRESGDLGFASNWLAKLPPWLVVSSTVYDTATPDVRNAYEIVSSDFGLAYANRVRWMTVLVLRRAQPLVPQSNATKEMPR